MIARVARRLMGAAIVVWAVVTIAFVISFILPGDPARAIAGPQARAADVARVRAHLDLDRPLPAQYARFATRIAHISSQPAGGASHASCASLGPLHVDLGMSYQRRQPVVRLVATRLPSSLVLAAGALGVQLLLGVLVGALAAVKRGTSTDRSLMLTSLGLASAPTFVTGVALQYFLAFRLRLFPLDGGGSNARDLLAHLALPALTLGLFSAGYYARLTRDELVAQRARDYVRTARAKGAPAWRVLVFHALRNALLPLVTAAGLDFGALVGGAVVTERVFRWPGLGALAVDAVLERDMPVVLGAVLVASLAVVAASLVVDASYALLDPRTRGA